MTPGRARWSSRPNRESLRKRNPTLAAFVLARDKRCVYCRATKGLQVDHLIPRSKGGTDDPRFVVTSCKRCNCARQARDLDEWQAYARRVHGIRFSAAKVREDAARTG
jgi:5-methylcytosine-specific restriction endonuclease McrA